MYIKLLMKKRLVLLLICIFYLSFASASLGISPAIREINFEPGKEVIINYKVYSDNPEEELSLRAEGDLQDYMTLSKKELRGSGSFTLTINFPEKIDLPGIHTIGVGVRQKPSDDQFIGTSIDISAVLKIYVPYPGRYVEASLSVIDGNIDEEIPVEVYVINRGKEDLNLNVKVNFFAEGIDLVKTINFDQVLLGTTEEKTFKKKLNTNGLKPGNYLADAVIDYGEERKINKTFKIGSLFVNVTNFTKNLSRGGIQRFLVDIESKWNGKIDEVYADINISNSTKSFYFRTPSVGLGAWERKILEGFLDTTGMEGEYNSEIVLIYSGLNTTVYGRLNVFKKGLGIIIYTLGLLAFLLLILMVYVIWRFRKNSLSQLRLKNIKYKNE